MKDLMARVFAGIALLMSGLVASEKPAIAVEGLSAELAAETSYITYEEPGITEEGVMASLCGALAWRNHSAMDGEGFVLKADGRVGFGQMDYDGQLSDGTPYKIDNIDDVLGEVRFSAGYDLSVFDGTRLTPYFGIGYRYLNDDLSEDPAGYERESNYVYSPIGVETRTDLGHDWFWGLSAEYDIFWLGWQKSHLSDAVASLSDVTNDQKGGYGVRGAVRIGRERQKFNWFLEAFVRYWDIDESERSSVALSGTIIGDVIEPKNQSTEIGLKAGLLF